VKGRAQGGEVKRRAQGGEVKRRAQGGEMKKIDLKVKDDRFPVLACMSCKHTTLSRLEGSQLHRTRVT
jgi:predicted nucleic-acid-binding Zn-ribbon protein